MFFVQKQFTIFKITISTIGWVITAVWPDGYIIFSIFYHLKQC